MKFCPFTILSSFPFLPLDLFQLIEQQLIKHSDKSITMCTRVMRLCCNKWLPEKNIA